MRRNLSINKFLRFLLLTLFLFAGCDNTPSTTPSNPEVMPTATNEVALQVTSPIQSVNSEQTWAVYQGANSHRGFPMFEVQYNTAKWKYSTDDPFGSALIHLEIPNCFLLLLNSDYAPNNESRRVQLAGREWLIYKWHEDFLLYRFADFGFGFSMVDNPTPDAKDSCQKAVEEVLSTFKPLGK